MGMGMENDAQSRPSCRAFVPAGCWCLSRFSLSPVGRSASQDASTVNDDAIRCPRLSKSMYKRHTNRHSTLTKVPQQWMNLVWLTQPEQFSAAIDRSMAYRRNLTPGRCLHAVGPKLRVTASCMAATMHREFPGAGHAGSSDHDRLQEFLNSGPSLGALFGSAGAFTTCECYPLSKVPKPSLRWSSQGVDWEVDRRGPASL
jgi:hypothetical protein